MPHFLGLWRTVASGINESDTYMEMQQLPKDPVMLMSALNMKLRDCYADLDSLCDDMQLDRASVEASLSAAGFTYLPEVNQFR